MVPVAGPKSRAVENGIERLHGEWLVWICCDVMGDHSEYLCVPPAGACGIERPHGEYMGNDWFWRAVLPLTCVPSGCFGNRASTWGMAS